VESPSSTARKVEEAEVGAPTLRDPDGFLLSHGDRIFRLLRPVAHTTLTDYLQTATATEFSRSGKLVRTWPANAAAQDEILAHIESNARDRGLSSWETVEHERIFFPSFPYEWPAEMLHAAASLTLDIAEKSLDEGFGLKDATPLNVLFQGPRPVFVDMLSFERRDLSDSIWLAYAQFVRTFLLPLAVQRHSGMDTLQRTFLTSRDGLDPEQVYAAVPLWRLLRPPYLSLVTLPTWLGGGARKRKDLYEKRTTADPERARFVLKLLFRGLRRQLERVRPTPNRRSVWGDYEANRSHYNDAQIAAKEQFVERVLGEARPATVLDIGANAGEHSTIAARLGAKVVAVDLDPAVVGENWRRAAAANLDILPLVVDFSRPTPAVGWRNREWPSFLSRARGRFDAVMMLAVVHHLLVTERIPLEEILQVAAEITKDHLLLEYVSPEDPMFQRLARGRDALYAHLTREHFEERCRRYFRIVSQQPLEGTYRTLYALRREP
jgi:SAM-dependent methyltransferase